MPSEGPHRRVILTGFMGAGKSTVGRLLAPLLGWRFLDVDTLLSAGAGTTIAQLFTRHGEQGFRAMEAELIAEQLEQAQVVVSLGGGAVEHHQTRARLLESIDSLVVYLQTPLAVALARCAAQPGSAVRPVLADADVVEHRFNARLPFYRAAHLTLPTDGQEPTAIAQQIAAAVRL